MPFIETELKLEIPDSWVKRHIVAPVKKRVQKEYWENIERRPIGGQDPSISALRPQESYHCTQ